MLGQWDSVTGCSIMTSLEIQHGGQLPVWEQLLRRISVKYNTIFDEIWYTDESDSDCYDSNLTKDKIFEFKMAYGRHIGNIFGYYSEAARSTCVKFCRKRQTQTACIRGVLNLLVAIEIHYYYIIYYYYMYSVSQKNPPPEGSWHFSFFSQTVENF